MTLIVPLQRAEELGEKPVCGALPAELGTFKVPTGDGVCGVHAELLSRASSPNQQNAWRVLAVNCDFYVVSVY